MTILVILAIRLVMPLLIADKVGEVESIMRRNENQISSNIFYKLKPQCRLNVKHIVWHTFTL